MYYSTREVSRGECVSKQRRREKGAGAVKWGFLDGDSLRTDKGKEKSEKKKRIEGGTNKRKGRGRRKKDREIKKLMVRRKRYWLSKEKKR